MNAADKQPKKRAGTAFERAFRAFGVRVLSLIARVKFRARASGADIPMGESAVVLCNHSCVWDFCFLISALRPRSVRFVATSIEFEKNKLYAWMLNALGVIKKTQGAPDVKSVRAMLRAKQAGDIVALYAAGMTSLDGRPAWPAQGGTEKLLKLLNAPVYAAITHGGFISRPRYAHKCFRGRVELSVTRLFTAEEVRALGLDALRAGIDRALNFNDWDWQERARVKFRGARRAQGVTRVLYECPDCAAEGALREAGHEIYCEACGMRAARDAYGWFHALKGKCPRRMDEWMDAQTARIRESLKSGGECLSARVRLMRPTGTGAGYVETDAGALTLDSSGLSFTGGAGALNWAFSEFQYFVLNDKDFLHIYAINGAYRFTFDDPRLIVKWFLTHRLITCA